MCDVSGSVICCSSTYFATCKQLSFVRKYKIHELILKKFDKEVYSLQNYYYLSPILAFIFYFMHYIEKTLINKIRVLCICRDKFITLALALLLH